MDNAFIKPLDEYFCANYSDYQKISAIAGYRMPDLIVIGKDGNIARRESERMRLCHQENCEELLVAFKNGLADTFFSYSFSFVPLRERIKDAFRKHTFAKLFPVVIKRCGETVESAGNKITLDTKIWNGIVKGRLYPEKNTILALAITCRIPLQDVKNLLAVCGFRLQKDSVRDVVAEYLISQNIYNEEMRDRCLSEYKIENLPIRRREKTSE